MILFGDGKPGFEIRIQIASEMFRKKEKKFHGLKRYLLTFSLLPTELKDSHGDSEIFLGDLGTNFMAILSRIFQKPFEISCESEKPEKACTVFVGSGSVFIELPGSVSQTRAVFRKSTVNVER